ncbi:MAG: GNAT family N-acetyltransferase [Dysgonamonadaceae bacterium]|nr:GNAT family N-acetyltransferase [Dysgonamonadaceae bacterium]MDD3309437.1 GNAT family N-acetyltransferase [Dysgonamonadaceae bacterium]MDD3899776.1 GNAT family N-acetyltransferase [Dysgonamonadaceae bacterium]MDD4399814.1 GNAT family N-acetyltransferase [Dysgonamonadaceae bacterium]
MITHIVYTVANKPTEATKKFIVDFLYENLEEYGDPKNDIEKCIAYALSDKMVSFGGFIITAIEYDKIVGCVVVNQTGMKDYIPENILVYIATHKKYRGKGIGKKLMQNAINYANGSIALHVEPDNPAIGLYKHLGFTSKYIEMRLIKKTE